MLTEILDCKGKSYRRTSRYAASRLRLLSDGGLALIVAQDAEGYELEGGEVCLGDVADSKARVCFADRKSSNLDGRVTFTPLRVRYVAVKLVPYGRRFSK